MGSIAQEIARREQEIALLKALEAAEQNPELRAIALSVLGAGDEPQRQKRSPSVQTRTTAADKIAATIRSAENAWHTIEQLANAAGCSESGVRQVLYRTHASQFEKRQKPGTRFMEFRLVLEEGVQHAD